jgi:hypothetical protein
MLRTKTNKAKSGVVVYRSVAGLEIEAGAIRNFLLHVHIKGIEYMTPEFHVIVHVGGSLPS